ncbi:hypothetical protein OBBRIDRAFT_826264 [Obba rivulosa]|uniref:Uncharacterized protein n=1 Tax=Obba rivulosa TaxID=1052685 RepID=A0A8E2AVG1_9APHY|nr:hypothetical protein OBBRIDRAFT_826264 [Obba rivulosa]
MDFAWSKPVRRNRHIRWSSALSFRFLMGKAYTFLSANCPDELKTHLVLNEQDAHGFNEVYDRSERIGAKHNMCKYLTCFIRPGTLAVVEFKLIKYWSKKYSAYGTQLQLGAIYYLNNTDPEAVRLAEERRKLIQDECNEIYFVASITFTTKATVKKGREVGSAARVSLPSEIVRSILSITLVMVTRNGL